jgi:hypothetical protein
VRTGSPASAMTGTNRGQLPAAHCQTVPPPTTPVTTDGPVRLSGRTPARGPPDQSSCRGREPRPTALGKSGCHLAPHPHGNASEQPQPREEPRLHTPTIRIRNSPCPHGETASHCSNLIKQSRNYPWTDTLMQVSAPDEGSLKRFHFLLVRSATSEHHAIPPQMSRAHVRVATRPSPLSGNPPHTTSDTCRAVGRDHASVGQEFACILEADHAVA